MEKLRVQMLGGFAMEAGGQRIDDSENRSRKIWLLLAYMVYFRSRPVTQHELFRLLWGDEDSKDDPPNALRVILHRARAMLNKLWDTAGSDLIVRCRDGYTWNAQAAVILDTEEFESLYKAGVAASEEDLRLEYYRRALQLYKGDFLDKLSSESWVRSVSIHYHDLYTNMAQETLLMLESRQCLQEAVALCRNALKVEPYSEAFHYHLIRDLLDMGAQKEAVAAYEEMRDVFITNFGTMPTEEIRGLYYEAIRKINDQAVPIELLLEQLRDTDTTNGALLCDFDFFKVVYYTASRMIARNGIAAHIGLITVSGKDGKTLSKRSMELAVENLQEQVCVNLRRGDAVTRCSISQFALLLQMANYENSCIVCERIIKSFFRKYPHSPVQLSYSVQALEPDAY